MDWSDHMLYTYISYWYCSLGGCCLLWLDFKPVVHLQRSGMGLNPKIIVGMYQVKMLNSQDENVVAIDSIEDMGRGVLLILLARGL